MVRILASLSIPKCQCQEKNNYGCDRFRSLFQYQSVGLTFPWTIQAWKYLVEGFLVRSFLIWKSQKFARFFKIIQPPIFLANHSKNPWAWLFLLKIFNGATIFPPPPPPCVYSSPFCGWPKNKWFTPTHLCTIWKNIEFWLWA